MAEQRSKKANKKAQVLWIEGRWKSNPEFIPSLEKKGFHVEKVTSGAAAVERLESKTPDLVVVDAASMHSSGKRICQSMRETVNGMPILLIRQAGEDEVELDCANVVLSLPFTSRKLVNRIKPLLPDDETNLQRVGPVSLDSENNYVRCHGKKTTLTPRLVRLLRMLMDKPGEVIERETLFKKVWRTDYTGDTRTLDVHISWLRQALELDPKKPELLKTVRGVGYCLNIEEKPKKK